MTELDDLKSFVAIARSGGFRGAARATGTSASRLSEALRRLEARLGVRLCNRTTRHVALTDAGTRLLERLEPAFAEIDASLDVVNGFRDRPAGKLRLNVPVSVARLVLARILPPFLAAYPDIQLEVIAEDRFADLVAEGCDAGIRYEERLEQDMVAIPIGPRRQRFALAASPTYLALHGRPEHPRDLVQHACLGARFSHGALSTWRFERGGEIVQIEPKGPLMVSAGTCSDLAIESAVAGAGVIYLFEDWLRPWVENKALEPLLEPWWLTFSGPFLYYPGRRLLPAPLRAFVDFVQSMPPWI